MKNTIYLDGDFNFLLLENEEEDTGLSQTKIYINIPTSAAANQRLEISVAGGAIVTENIASNANVNFELSQGYWADNNDVEITPKNDDITGDTITIHFPKTFTTSAALNYIFDDEFELLAQEESFAEEGSGSGSGSGGNYGANFDFVETIRNIGMRLLDEPTNVSAYFDKQRAAICLKWTDPLDIAENEPVPCTWAGTVVVRKEGSAPLHRWDGVLITDSTTRNQYQNTELTDNTIQTDKTYYYGIFPYHIALDDATAPIKYYRYTKIVSITTKLESSIVFQAVATVNGLVDQITGESAIIDAGTYTYDNATQAIKAETYSDLHFAAPPALTEITNDVKQITFEAEVMQYADTAGSLSHDFDFTLWKPITSTFYNGTDDPPGVSQDIAMYDDFGNHVAHEAPLDSNIGQFHILKYVHTLNNGKITHLTVYMDNAVFYDTDLNINLSVLTIARIESKAVEYSYIKSIKIGVEY